MTFSRNVYLICVVLVLALGITSRVFHTGVALIDKYLGDALYAILAYLLLSVAWAGGQVWKKAAVAAVLMAAIEMFQLTLIPDRLARSGSLALRLLAIALGTQFSWRDMLAYAVGIAGVAVVDRGLVHVSSRM